MSRDLGALTMTDDMRKYWEKVTVSQNCQIALYECIKLGSGDVDHPVWAKVWHNPTEYVSRYLYTVATGPDYTDVLVEMLKVAKRQLMSVDATNAALQAEVNALLAKLDFLNKQNDLNAQVLADRQKEADANIANAKARADKMIATAYDRAKREVEAAERNAWMLEQEACKWRTLYEKRLAQLEALLALEAKLKIELEEMLRLPQPGMMIVEVVEARNLVSTDRLIAAKGDLGLGEDASDAFVGVHWGDQKPDTTVKKHKNPVWGEPFFFNCQNKEIEEVDLYVKDSDKFTASDLIGRVSINCWDCYDGKVIDEWYRIRGAESGELHVRINFTTGIRSPNGKVRVTVMEAKNLLAADSGGTSDPFVCPTWCGDVSKVVHKTRTIQKTLTPNFDEDFTFHVTGREMNSRIDANLLKFVVKDDDKFSGADDLGVAMYDMRLLVDNERIDLWLPLSDESKFMVKFDGPITGSLRVQLEWITKK